MSERASERACARARPGFAHFLRCSDKAGETEGDGIRRGEGCRGGGNAACRLEEIQGLSVCCVQQHQYLMKTLSADTVPVYLNKHNPSTPQHPAWLVKAKYTN